MPWTAQKLRLYQWNRKEMKLINSVLLCSGYSHFLIVFVSIILGSSSIDLQMCQSWNSEFRILHNIGYDFFNVYFLTALCKQKVLLLKNQQISYWSSRKSLLLSFKLLSRSWKKYNKCYVPNIQNSNFGTLANQRMSYQGH